MDIGTAISYASVYNLRDDTADRFFVSQKIHETYVLRDLRKLNVKVDNCDALLFYMTELMNDCIRNIFMFFHFSIWTFLNIRLYHTTYNINMLFIRVLRPLIIKRFLAFFWVPPQPPPKKNVGNPRQIFNFS